MEKHIYKMGGMKLIVAGLALMAMSTVGVNVIAIFKLNYMVPAIGAVVGGIGWISAATGLLTIQTYRREFKKAVLAGLIGLGAKSLELYLIYGFYKNNFLNQAFVSEKVLFLAYVSDIAMLAVYMTVSEGGAQLMAKYGEIREGRRLRSMAEIGAGIILICLIVVPFGHIFDGLPNIFISGIAAFTALICQIIICFGMDRIYKTVDGRKI